MQALRSINTVSSPASSPMLAANAGALDAETSCPGTQFTARLATRDVGRGAPRFTPKNGVLADKFNQVDWLELSMRAFNERFFADDWENAKEVYGG
jgi:hypothetical protein